MAGKSRLSEQESGFKTAERKGIRLSGPLSPGSAQPSQPAAERRRRRGADTVRKQKVERRRRRRRRRRSGTTGNCVGRSQRPASCQLEVPAEKRHLEGRWRGRWVRFDGRTRLAPPPSCGLPASRRAFKKKKGGEAFFFVAILSLVGQRQKPRDNYRVGGPGGWPRPLPLPAAIDTRWRNISNKARRLRLDLALKGTSNSERRRQAACADYRRQRSRSAAPPPPPFSANRFCFQPPPPPSMSVLDGGG